MNEGKFRRMPIDTSYKKHDIHATALELKDTHEWEPRITISWSEGCQTMMKLLDLKRLFSTRQEAENYALVFAKKWIDSGGWMSVET
jgi:hypothetical protein